MRRRVLDEQIARWVSILPAVVVLLAACPGCAGGKRARLVTAQATGAHAADGVELAELPPYRTHAFVPPTARNAPGTEPAATATPGSLPIGDLSELGRSSDCT